MLGGLIGLATLITLVVVNAMSSWKDRLTLTMLLFSRFWARICGSRSCNIHDSDISFLDQIDLVWNLDRGQFVELSHFRNTIIVLFYHVDSGLCIYILVTQMILTIVPR